MHLVWFGLLFACRVAQEGSTTEAPPARHDYAPLARAVEQWRAQPAITGRYRSTLASDYLPFDRKPRSAAIRIREGIFAFAAPSRSRITDTAWSERSEPDPDAADPPKKYGLDLLYADRTVIQVTTSPSRLPATIVTSAQGAVFDEHDPFVMKVGASDSPFGAGDVASGLRQLTQGVVFTKTETVVEDGRALLVHAGEADFAAMLEHVIAERNYGFGILTMQRGSDERLREFRVREAAAQMFASRHVRVFVDQDGFVAGWDVGPRPGTVMYSLRLSELKLQVAPDAFVLDPELRAIAVDQTPGMVANLDAVRPAFDDAAAVARLKSDLLEELQRMVAADSIRPR
ncbi:MAG: hypothetical protein AAF211_14965 [Myxococcota bacterium]